MHLAACLVVVSHQVYPQIAMLSQLNRSDDCFLIVPVPNFSVDFYLN
jgi:hypothetical protein